MTRRYNQPISYRQAGIIAENRARIRIMQTIYTWIGVPVILAILCFIFWIAKQIGGY